jgi:hypothetical protein
VIRKILAHRGSGWNHTRYRAGVRVWGVVEGVQDSCCFGLRFNEASPGPGCGAGELRAVGQVRAADQDVVELLVGRWLEYTGRGQADEHATLVGAGQSEALKVAPDGQSARGSVQRWPCQINALRHSRSRARVIAWSPPSQAMWWRRISAATCGASAWRMRSNAVLGSGRSPTLPRRPIGDTSKGGCLPSHSRWLAWRLAAGAVRAQGWWGRQRCR